ncbi:diheme cytochrome C [Phormidium tenue FACHB-886]|nr:diheme cytochrome C [Phormidium tenue FACHB-886]
MQSRSKIVSDKRSSFRGRRSRHRSPVVLILVLLLCSGVLGWGWSQAALPQPLSQSQVPAQTAPTQAAPAQTAPVETTDPVPERYQLGQQLYLENCATCHVALPPAVMPTRTWAEIMPDSSHYGVQITPLSSLSLQVAWQYISTYSRPLNPGEEVPYRLRQSRYFKALHPKVEFSQPITVSSCAACHPAAAQFNYRSLTREWENTP